jgi:endonuclease YncB( thermonuclease family)
MGVIGMIETGRQEQRRLPGRWRAACPGVLVVVWLLVGGAERGWRTDVVPGPVPALVIEVVDGDTITVRARIWVGQDVETKVRLSDVDTPETNGRCGRERELAAHARAFVIETIGDDPVKLIDVHYGKYAGRVVAHVETAAGDDLAVLLIAAGLGRPYHGGARISWCDSDDSDS